MVDSIEFLRATLDPIRLAVLGDAVSHAVDPSLVADRLGVPERKVLQAVARLRSSGILDDDLRLDREALRGLASNLPRAAPPDPEVAGVGTWSDDELEVLGRFFSGRRLTSIPGSRAKRLVVLDRLSQEFEPGLRYEEREVNFALQLWHADYASLRRYLVDEGFLTRADGVYWRTGGRYDAPQNA